MSEFNFMCGTPFLQRKQHEWFMALSEEDKLEFLRKLDEHHSELQEENKIK